MKATASWIRGGIFLVAFALLSGCGGVAVEVDVVPKTVFPGQSTAINVKVTNASRCPAPQQEVIVLPLLSNEVYESLLESIPDPNSLVSSLYLGILQIACTGEGTLPPVDGTFPGASCVLLPGGFVECTIEDDTVSLAPEQALGASVGCDTGGDSIVCEAQAYLKEALAKLAGPEGFPPRAQANGDSCLLVESDPTDIFVCETPPIAPGAAATLHLLVPAPASGAPFTTLAVDQTGVGACKGGATPGAACDENADCPSAGGGDCAADPNCECADSICVGGPHPGYGCSDPNDVVCGGGDCEPCVPEPGPGPVITMPLPFGCAQTGLAVPPVPAPALSTGGIAATVLLLLLLGGASLLRLVATLRK